MTASVGNVTVPGSADAPASPVTLMARRAELPAAVPSTVLVKPSGSMRTGACGPCPCRGCEIRTVCTVLPDATGIAPASNRGLSPPSPPPAPSRPTASTIVPVWLPFTPAPPNATVCMAVPSPDTPDTGRASLPSPLIETAAYTGPSWPAGGPSGAEYVMATVLRAANTALAVASPGRTAGGASPARLSGSIISEPIGSMAASRTAVASITSEPVVPCPAGSPPNDTVCTPVPFPSSPSTGRGSPPDDSATDAYAPESAHTGSVYRTSALFGPATKADAIEGAIPSATPVDEAASALPALSSTFPAAGSYKSSTASGAVSGSGPSSASMSESDGTAMSWLEATAMPAASPPDTDHPPAPAPGASTGSSNTTRMASRDAAVALRTDGGWVSPSTIGPSSPSASMAASRMAAESTSSEPVSSWPTGLPPNDTVCTAVPFPPISVTRRGSPPESSETDAYAP